MLFFYWNLGCTFLRFLVNFSADRNPNFGVSLQSPLDFIWKFAASKCLDVFADQWYSIELNYF